MRRASVVGNSGSGKTALGRAFAERIGCRYVELDGIFHQSDWVPLPTEQFRDAVERIAATGSWVIDGNYSVVRDLVWRRADTLVFLDLPRRT
ncbi:MAG: AAA family ATPase [Mycobacteriales bacterium]